MYALIDMNKQSSKWRSYIPHKDPLGMCQGFDCMESGAGPIRGVYLENCS